MPVVVLDTGTPFFAANPVSSSNSGDYTFIICEPGQCDVKTILLGKCSCYIKAKLYLDLSLYSKSFKLSNQFTRKRQAQVCFS